MFLTESIKMNVNNNYLYSTGFSSANVPLQCKGLRKRLAEQVRRTEPRWCRRDDRAPRKHITSGFITYDIARDPPHPCKKRFCARNAMKRMPSLAPPLSALNSAIYRGASMQADCQYFSDQGYTEYIRSGSSFL